MPMTGQEEMVYYENTLLQVLIDAHVPIVIDTTQHQTRQVVPETSWVALEPAMRALQVSSRDQRYLRDMLREHYPEHLASCDRGAWRMLLLRASRLSVLAHKGRHPVAVQYSVWHSGVVSALLRHGIYNPATNHEPEPGEELDALEQREHFQEVFCHHFPMFRSIYRPELYADEEDCDDGY